MSFTNQGHDLFASRNISYEDISKFVVVIFCPNYIDEDTNKEFVQFTIRFTVYIGDNNEEITFGFNNKIILDALAEKIYKREYGSLQRMEFEYGRPNGLELFDAEFYLMELLDLETI
jgi:hypothetical protein